MLSGMVFKAVVGEAYGRTEKQRTTNVCKYHTHTKMIRV